MPEEVQCNCSTCVSMCEQRPCWGTPKEIEAIVDAGFGDKLMQDYWEPDGTHPAHVYMAQPAIVGYEGTRAPWSPHGTCAFLKNNLCTLHDKGLKPIEGRLAACANKRPDREPYNKEMHQLRVDIVDEWDTPEGQSVLEKINFS
jgi:hypothetical protein